MNRRRLVAALFFSAVVVATLAVIVYTERANAGQTLPVWVLTHDVSAGAPFKAADVQQEQVAMQEATHNYQQASPDQAHARYSRNLRAQDILRADDLTADRAVAEVALALQNAPPLNAGDSIDIFAALPNGRQARIGRSVTVVSVSGTTIDVLVPAGDEAAWIAVSSTSTSLHAARSAPDAREDADPLSAGDAIGILCGASCANAALSASPTP